jgi:hypothetical protein
MRILVDDQLSVALSGIEEPVEIRDASGRTYGFYHPAQHSADPEAKVTSPFSDEELERRRKTPGGRPLAEIWRDLGAR